MIDCRLRDAMRQTSQDTECGDMRRNCDDVDDGWMDGMEVQQTNEIQGIPDSGRADGLVTTATISALVVTAAAT